MFYTEMMLWLILTSLTGGFLTLLWIFVGEKLENRGYINIVYVFLLVVSLFWMVPFAYVLNCLLDETVSFWHGLWSSRTPALGSAFLVLAAVWLIGVLAGAAAYLISIIYLHRMRRKAVRCDKGTEALFREVEAQLGIRPGRVSLAQSFDIKISCTFGVFRPIVLIPVNWEFYDEEELRTIFLHELIHCKQKVALFRHLATWIVCIHFFNPCAWLYRSLLQKWGEYACDYYACSRKGEYQAYFRTIVNVMSCAAGFKKDPVVEQMQALAVKDESELRRRANRMKRIFEKKQQPGWKNFRLAVLMFICSVLVITGVSTGTAKIYAAAYARTEVVVVEEVESDSLVEMIDTEDLSEYTILDVGELDQKERSSKSISWTVSAKSVKDSSSFYVKSGGTISIVLNVDPDTTYVYAGIVEPDGTRRCVHSCGLIVHTFELDQTGYYQIYVRNPSSSTSVTVDGSVVYFN